MRWYSRPAALCLLFLASPADANDLAAVEQGRALLKEHNCNGSCHQSYSEDNDPLTLYTRESRKARTRAQLDAQVKYCVSALGTMIFPEDLESVSAALDHDFYKFK